MENGTQVKDVQLEKKIFGKDVLILKGIILGNYLPICFDSKTSHKNIIQSIDRESIAILFF